MEQRIVQRIIHKFGKLLGERLDIAIFDNGRRGVQIGTEYERISGGRIHAMRSPGTANGRVPESIERGVMGDSNDQLARQPGKLTEEFFLNEFDIGDGEGSVIFSGLEYVSVAYGNVDLERLDLRLVEQRMPVLRLRKDGAQHGIGVLRRAARFEGEVREDRGPQDMRYIRSGVHDKCFPGLKRKRYGNEHSGNGGASALCRVVAQQGVGALLRNVPEGRYGVLGMHDIERRNQ